jgi:hypothetical protein
MLLTVKRGGKYAVLVSASWVLEERILALDVYFRYKYKLKSELSKDERARLRTAILDLTDKLNLFRSSSMRDQLSYKTVRRKLLDFQAAEPAPYTNGSGKYLEDQDLWRKYVDKPDELHHEAERIRAALEYPKSAGQPSTVESLNA